MLTPQWAVQRRVEQSYESTIRQLFDHIIKQESQGTQALTLMDFFTRLNTSANLQELAELAAGQMVHALLVHNARTWREASQQAMRGTAIYRGLQEEMRGTVGDRVRALIRDNARLISSVPRYLQERIASAIAQGSQRGLRATTIEATLRKRLPKMAASRIKLIARTETSKASTALTQARAESFGVPAYVWRSSHDQRVRPSHRFLNDVVVLWEDPPSPEALLDIASTLGHYNAGNCPNCRCYPQPLLRPNLLVWPHRVYSQGVVRQMTYKQFLGLTGRAARLASNL